MAVRTTNVAVSQEGTLAYAAAAGIDLRRDDEIRQLRINGLLPGDTSEPFSTAGFDLAVFFVVASTGSGPIQLQAVDLVNNVARTIKAGTGESVYAAASELLAGYCLALPARLQVLNPAAGGPTSADVVVQLRRARRSS